MNSIYRQYTEGEQKLRDLKKDKERYAEFLKRLRESLKEKEDE